MRFTSFIAAGLFAVAASAQSSTDAPSSTPVSSIDPAQSSAVLSEIQQCLAACDPKDTDCRADCISVPTPDNQNVEQTTACVAACPQGNGTAEDNLAYSDCVQGCIGQYYFTNTGTPNPTSTGNGGSGNSGSASVTPSVTQIGTVITSDGSTFTTSFPSTAAVNPSESSNSPQSTSSSHAAAAVYGPVGTGMGLFGLLAGFLAL